MIFLQQAGIFLFVFFGFPAFIHAQKQISLKDKCGTTGPSQAWEAEFQKLVTQYTSKQTANKVQQTYIIPVIVHIIHGGEPVGTYPNLAQSDINSQIITLNNDFAGTASNANYPANAFAAWAATANVSPASLDAFGRVAIADCNIEFCLATTDTNGNVLPEPGIERLDYNVRGWPNPAGNSFNSLSTFYNLYENTIKPQSIWDVTKYLNIWVSENHYSLGLLGYAPHPYLSTLNDLPANDIGTSTTDGIFCVPFAFGYQSHLATHEAGHWLGLWHTWGDALCGSDYCNDTPPAPLQTNGVQTYPFNVNGCAGAGNGVMFMNHMDYTHNDFKYMFTTDQGNRMQTAMANSPYRKYLGTHNLCSTQNASVVSAFTSLNTVCTGQKLNLTNQSLGWPASYGYTWTANGGTFNPGPQAASPSIEFSGAGIYTITLTADNGATSVFTKTVNVTSPALNLSSTSQTICEGVAANFTADGLETYTWQPGTIVNSIAGFTPSTSQSYTCYGTNYNGCTANKTVEVIVAPCTGLSSYMNNELKLQLYPNPSKDMVNLKINSKAASQIVIQITDALGRMISQQKINMLKGEQVIPMDVSGFNTGVYFVKVQTAEGFTKTVKIVKKE